MPLAPTLGAIAELHDLPRLLAELGHEPLWRELPVMPGTRRAATVGRRGRFAWLGVEGRTPPVQLAERLARRLACDGNVSGVIALYPEKREIAIAVAFGDPAALRIDLDAPDRIALACLERLRAPGDGTATAYAARAADALAGRGIGRDFFRQFRATLDAMAEGTRRREPDGSSAGAALPSDGARPRLAYGLRHALRAVSLHGDREWQSESQGPG